MGRVIVGRVNGYPFQQLLNTTPFLLFLVTVAPLFNAVKHLDYQIFEFDIDI